MDEVVEVLVLLLPEGNGSLSDGKFVLQLLVFFQWHKLNDLAVEGVGDDGHLARKGWSLVRA